MVSISGKLTLKPACELLLSYGISLSTIEFLVRASFVQRVSVDYVADIGNYVVGSCRLPLFLRGLFIALTGSCVFAFLSRLMVIASVAARPAAKSCCEKLLRQIANMILYHCRCLQLTNALEQIYLVRSEYGIVYYTSSALVSSAKVDSQRLEGLYGESRGFFLIYLGIQPPSLQRIMGRIMPLLRQSFSSQRLKGEYKYLTDGGPVEA